VALIIAPLSHVRSDRTHL